MRKVVRFGFAVLMGWSLVGASAARAADCGGQAGKTIFEDTFKDDSGGFASDEQAKFNAPGLRMTLAKTEDNWPYVTDSFNATDGDYCTIAVVPAPVGPGNLGAVGLTLLYADNDNMVAVFVYSDNTVQIERRVKGQSDLILNEEMPAVGATPGAPVSVRAVVQDGEIAAFVNGIALRKVRFQAPEGGNKFGLYASVDKVPGREVAFEFRSLRVTAGADAKK